MSRSPVRIGALAIAAMLTLASCSAPRAETTTLVVYAAASLTDVFDSLADEFERDHPGVDVVINYGGSGALAAQLGAGAPADVFAAAGEPPMDRLRDAGLVEAPVDFATNTPALVTPPGNPGGVVGLADLADPALTIALCDPSVPCGQVAERLMAAAGLVASPDTLEQDVRAVVTKVELGEVDAGLVYASDVRSSGDRVEVVDVAGSTAVVTRYPIAVLAEAANSVGARDWVAFVLGPGGRAALSSAGFGSA